MVNSVVAWVNRHDVAKLLLITIAAVPVILLTVLGPSGVFLVVLLAAPALWGVGGYWVGNRTWLFIPLGAMAVEIAIAIPLTLADPQAGETPLSVILEAPFWTGAPALVAAWVGHRMRRRRAATARSGGRSD